MKTTTPVWSSSAPTANSPDLPTLSRSMPPSRNNQPAPTRTFPRTCIDCRQKRVVPVHINHTRNVKYDGVTHTLDLIDVPAERCENCGEVTFGTDSDEVMFAALREKIGLLSPAEIRTRREALDLTQQALADAIRCAPESISRWETGALIQSRAYDCLLCLYFDVPEARAYLAQKAGKTVPFTVVEHQSHPQASSGIVRTASIADRQFQQPRNFRVTAHTAAPKGDWSALHQPVRP
jgi:putative zinc finger/helix-turn-helix YgiT family protein